MSEKNVISILQVMNVKTKEIKVLKEFDGIIEAPNWRKRKNSLIYNSNGKIFEFDLNLLTEREVDTGYCTNCNNDHVLSFDDDFLAVSHQTKEDDNSRIYIIPLDKNEKAVPKLITPMGPSYLHGWSPDKKTLAFCGARNGQYDIYTIPSDGGEEKQLTDLKGLDDGPEYSPDGKHIWFNSTRTGLMQVWRMDSDGKNQTQMTKDENNSWFPHVSPDGEKIVYLTYYKGDVDPGDHPREKNVEIRLMPSKGGDFETLVKLFGGQGTINVNSWSPDSENIAFVSYKYKD